jgi:sterol desaturase/sphingolipid hydroxylase (fatty acid hydroxylase superfamily)
LTLIVLDFAIWLQHLLAHRIPLLWRLHQMHHADPDIDVTTAIRFHPIEIAFSMLYKIGAPPVAVLAFEAILNGCALFNHANVSLPSRIEAMLRLVVVTPHMHRVHHSTVPLEHHSNFGFNLSVWDRLFGTFTAEPAGGHEGMTIGLAP